MRIAYIISSLANAGPINVVYDLVITMQHFGHECVVYYFSDIVEKDFPCKTIKINLFSKIDWSQYDVIHTHGGRPDLFLILHKPFNFRGRVVSTIHSNIFEDHLYKYGKIKSKITTRIILALTCRHDKVIVLNNAIKKIYSHFIPKQKLEVVYNSRVISGLMEIERDDINRIDNFRRQYKNIIGTVCGIGARKGLEQVIKVLSKLPDTGFIIVGDGVQKGELECLANINCPDQVLFMGRKDDGYRYLSMFDVFIIPSRSEGFPLALLEAASIGKPCVTSNIEVFKEVFTEKEVSFFELDNQNSLIEAIQKAFDKGENYSLNIKKKFIECYSPEVQYKRHMEVYFD